MINGGAMNFVCPACNSDNVQRLSIVYLGGLSSIETRSRGSGLAIGGDGIGLGMGRTKTTGTAQTVASMRAAPPPKKRFLKPAGLILLAYLFVVPLVYASPVKLHMTEFAWATTTIGWLLFAMYYNLKKWPLHKSLWDNTCLCSRCDTIFYLGDIQ